MTFGLLFPGQGAQHVEMGRAFFENYPEAREVFERADQVLGIELSKLCFEGPEASLEATDICQPAILVTGLAIVEVLKRHVGVTTETFAATAGLSLGEYTALCFAEALSFEDAVRLVRARGIAMQRASEQSPSGMLTLVGADRELAETIAKEAGADQGGVMVAANFLAPGQIALSGDTASVDRAEAMAKEKGVRRAVRLKVAGAFHSPLMAPAGDDLRRELDRTEIRAPKIPVYSNVTAEPVQDPDTVRELLGRQVVSSVLWEDSMAKMAASGVETFVEPGPGKVLCGLARKIVRGKKAVSVERPEDLEPFRSAISSTGQEEAAS